ncbi:replication termination factor 2 [Anabrus simplex]|uniref:replication termination factor 2 n=1 Tax=Anabrus simplex TaxID=316456 RepID=UPI0034DDBEC3
MGCDGGTIPRRDELVRKKKKPEQKDKDSELSFRWRHCSLTQQPLQPPIVACGLGRLYNKDAVIEALLDKTNLPETAQHIKNLKDIRELKLTPNPAFKPSAEKGDAYIDRQTAPYICPVIGLEMNGKFRFAFLWSCGCVVSERALKEVKTQVCHKCQQPFTVEDVIILNGTAEDAELMQKRLEIRQARLKAEKKSRNEEKRKMKTNSTLTSGDLNKTDEQEGSPSSTSSLPVQDKPLPSKSTSKINGTKLNGATKRPTTTELEDPLFKKVKNSYSVAKDPSASEVYKSLFTSHQKAHQQTKAHWITYNPFYN